MCVCPFRVTQILAPSLVAYTTIPPPETPAALTAAACVQGPTAGTEEEMPAAPGESGTKPPPAVQRTPPHASLPHNITE